MQPFVIVKVEVAAQAVVRFLRVGVVVQIDLFVFHAPPQAFGQDVVQGSPTAVHANLHVRGGEQLNVLRAREVAALITVPDLGLSLRQRPLHSGQDKGHFQRLVQFPTHDIARVPIEHSDQIEPALQQPHIRDVYPPYLIGSIDRQMSQQIRVNAVGGTPFAQVGTGTDACQTHFLHVALHGFAIDDELGSQVRGNAARAIEGMRRVELINPVLDCDFFRRRWERLVIQTGPAEPQEVRLRFQREGRRLPFDQGQALSVTQGQDQIFF